MNKKEEFINIDKIKNCNGKVSLVNFKNIRKLKKKVVDDYVFFNILYSLAKKEFDSLDDNEKRNYLFGLKDYHKSNIDVGKLVKEYVIAPVSIFVGLAMGVILSNAIQMLLGMFIALFVVGVVIVLVTWKKGYDQMCLDIIEKYVGENEILF